MKDVIKYMRDNHLNPLQVEFFDIGIKKELFGKICEKYNKDGREFLLEDAIGMIEVKASEGKGSSKRITSIKLSLLLKL